MKIGYVQNEVKFGDKKYNFDSVKNLLQGAIADLIIVPELFATGYTFTSKDEAFDLAEIAGKGETTDFLIDLAKSTKAVIVGGFVEKENEKVYNSALIVDENGVIDTYRKIHLFNKEKLWFSPGNKELKVYEKNGFKFGVMICFDWIFPEVTRTLALKGADIIAHSTNLVMPYCQKAMVTRCLENRVFAVTANRIGREHRGEDDFNFTGASQITAFNGDILASAPIDKEDMAIVEIEHTLARNKNINNFNNIFEDRRVEFFSL